jgi:hypothetical protein
MSLTTTSNDLILYFTPDASVIDNVYNIIVVASATVNNGMGTITSDSTYAFDITVTDSCDDAGSTSITAPTIS